LNRPPKKPNRSAEISFGLFRRFPILSFRSIGELSIRPLLRSQIDKSGNYGDFFSG
jgi:hypothetical protein